MYPWCMDGFVSGRRIGVVGRLGVYPMARFTLPARRIVAYLAVNGGFGSREEAAEALWPALSQQKSKANLRRGLWQVPDGWLNSAGSELSLDASIDLVDARHVASLAIGGGELTFDDIELLSSDVLPGWNEEWLHLSRAAFRLLRVQALEAACLTMAGSGRFALATRSGTAALAAEPLRESAAGALTLAHLAQGNRYAAAQLFHDFARLLYDELGVAPSAALVSCVKGALPKDWA